MSKHRFPNVWVVPFRGGWLPKVEGHRLPDFPVGVTQAAAIALAESYAHRAHAEIIIQGCDGRIRQRDSHGHDNRRRAG